MLVGVMVLGTALNSSQLVLISGLHRQWGLSDQLFVLGDSMVLTVRRRGGGREGGGGLHS